MVFVVLLFFSEQDPQKGLGNGSLRIKITHKMHQDLSGYI